MGTLRIVETAIAIALVLSRMGGFMVMSPFPGQWVPKQVRVALLLGLSLPIGLALPTPRTGLVFDLTLLPFAINEISVGLLIGGAFRMVVIAAEFMAGLISQASWLSVPSSMNPDFGGQAQALGQVSMMLALLLALGAGVHRIVFAYLLESFHVLPVGSVMHLTDGILPFLGLVARSFDVGMSLALPVLGISLAVQTGLALISRVAPSLQIFSVGFAVLVGTGLITFMASLPSISAGMLSYFQVLGPFLDDLLLRLVGT
jgi:flagellar biosynthetic protein FliR